LSAQRCRPEGWPLVPVGLRIQRRVEICLQRIWPGYSAKNGAVSEWALPISATYIIDRNGVIISAYTDADYRDRADPIDILTVLKRTAAAA